MAGDSGCMSTTPHSHRLSHLARATAAVVVWFTVVALTVALAPRGIATAAPGEAGARWSWPLSPLPAVERLFERPPTRYAAGHRGIDVAASPGQEVTAVAPGVVTHSGVVVDRGTVTVRHEGGVSSTYEPLEDRIAVGESVAAGTVLGVIGGGGHCGGEHPCLHLGARLGEEYLDPLLLLTRVRIVLLPLLDE